MDTQTTSHGHVETGVDAVGETSAIVGSDSGLIVNRLGRVRFLKAAHEMYDVTVVGVEL